MDEKNILSAGQSTPNFTDTSKHTASRIQADTLFNFTTQLTYIIESINNKLLSPRYCEEDEQYLSLENIKSLYFPMKCFCDINLHRLGEHLSMYGYYGLAFSKEWGMKRGIQPIQYINPDSGLRAAFANAFNEALRSMTAEDYSHSQEITNSYLLHQLAFIKPYQGMIQNRVTGNPELKCFTDECEWRFVPDLSNTGYKQAYDQDSAKMHNLEEYNKSMGRDKKLSLQFDYSDIKYIIVKESSDLLRLVDCINHLNVDNIIKYELISKTIVWETSKGDF